MCLIENLRLRENRSDCGIVARFQLEIDFPNHCMELGSVVAFLVHDKILVAFWVHGKILVAFWVHGKILVVFLVHGKILVDCKISVDDSLEEIPIFFGS